MAANRLQLLRAGEHFRQFLVSIAFHAGDSNEFPGADFKMINAENVLVVYIFYFKKNRLVGFVLRRFQVIHLRCIVTDHLSSKLSRIEIAQWPKKDRSPTAQN